MSRKKTALEALSHEETDQSLAKVRHVKHKTEWIEEHPIEETAEDADLTLADDEIIEQKPKKRVINNERDELRKKLAKNNVTPASQLKLTIEKYPHSDVIDGQGGVFAETEHCAKYVCNESHILSEDYLDVARNKFGSGLYRFTLRMRNQIVTAWDKRISAGAPIVQNANPNDPNSPPTVVYQTNGDNQQVAAVPTLKDMMRSQKEALKEHLEMTKLMREAYGFAPEQPTNQPRSEEEILTSAILKQPEMIENVVGNLIKRVGGKGGGDDEPWWASILKDSITTGQLAPTVQGIVKGLFPNGLFGGLSNLLPGGQNNGQTQMGAQTVSPVAHTQNDNPQESRPALPTNAEGQGHGAIQEGMATRDQQNQDPYAQMLTGVITTLAINGPVDDAIKRVNGFLLFYPDWREHVDNQFDQPAETLLEAISTIPGCEQIAQAEHAKGWIENFQAKFFTEGSEEG